MGPDLLEYGVTGTHALESAAGSACEHSSDAQVTSYGPPTDLG